MKVFLPKSWLLIFGVVFICASTLQGTKTLAAEKANDKTATTQTSTAPTAMIQGAELGKWTQDYDAALKLAKEKNLPIMLDFTGSDWCPWCQLMDRRVLDTDKWLKYAKHHMVLVKLDFPRNEDLVPKDYRERNLALQDQYDDNQIFPTYVILASDGKTELGRITTGRYKSPESFISDIKDLLRRNPSAEDKLARELSPELAKKYRKALDDMQKTQQEERTWMAGVVEETPEVTKKYQAYEQKIAADEDTAYKIEVDHMISKLDKAKAATVRQLLKEELAAKKALRDWTALNPPQTQANIAKYKQLVAKVEKAHRLIQSYWP